MTDDYDIRRARRRRRRADDILIALAATQIADAARLADMTGMSPTRVIRIVEGGIGYRPAYSYLAQGLAKKVPRHQATYAITPAGSEVAEQVAREQARRPEVTKARVRAYEM